MSYIFNGCEVDPKMGLSAACTYIQYVPISMYEYLKMYSNNVLFVHWCVFINKKGFFIVILTNNEEILNFFSVLWQLEC